MNNTGPKSKASDGKSPSLEQLQALLLAEERHKLAILREEVKRLDQELHTKEKLAVRVDPIVEDHLQRLHQNFPKLFGPVITDTIRYQIKNAQNEMVDALYPIIGKLIRKYIAREIEMLSERVDRQLEKAFSWEGWKRRIKAWFTGSKTSDVVMQGLAEPVIEEIFLIEQESGMLYGSYSRTKSIDQDMIAGMLTAIKSFVADAFKKGEQDLESIEYESYHIIFRNFKTYYLAVVVSGVITAAFKDQLEATILNFADKLRKNAMQKEQGGEDVFLTQLEQFFGQAVDGK